MSMLMLLLLMLGFSLPRLFLLQQHHHLPLLPLLLPTSLLAPRELLNLLLQIIVPGKYIYLILNSLYLSLLSCFEIELVTSIIFGSILLNFCVSWNYVCWVLCCCLNSLLLICEYIYGSHGVT